jgi:3-isopropylmalate/(R)-2-methylmalate dehydratase small subunit
MILRGRAWKFGDDISTDHITPGRYYHLRSNMSELAKHVMEDADPEFPEKMKKGDFVVGGKNFGMGSSREHAPLALKIAGVSAVIAKSFARIFYRNSINIGLPILIVNTDKINPGDELEVNLSTGVVKDLTNGVEMRAQPMPEEMIKVLQAGGIVNLIKEQGDLTV